MENTIITLDGKFWDKNDLISKMYDDEFYYGYLASAVLSSSSLKDLLKSPKVYYNSLIRENDNDSQALRDGHLFHQSILEIDKFSENTFVDVKSKATKLYKEAVESSNGKKVYTESERLNALRLRDAFMRNDEIREMIEACDYEIPIVGEVMDMPFRGKADAVCDSFLLDLKTTTDIHSFYYSAKKWHYDIQVYLYCNLFGIDYKDFFFAVIDKQSLELGLYDCSEEFYFRGESKVAQAIETYKEYFTQHDEGIVLDKKKIYNYNIKGTL